LIICNQLAKLSHHNQTEEQMTDKGMIALLKSTRIIIFCLFFALLFIASRHHPSTYNFNEVASIGLIPTESPSADIALLKEMPAEYSRTEQITIPTPATSETKPAQETTKSLRQIATDRKMMTARQTLPVQEPKQPVALTPTPIGQPPVQSEQQPVQNEQPPLPETPVQEKPPEEQKSPVPEQENHDRALNSYVLAVVQSYQSGRYPYLLNNDYDNYNGVTTNIFFQGRLLARAHPSGSQASHCVGITFEVFFRAMQERNRRLGLSPDDFNGMNWGELFDFMLLWYVATGSKQTSNLAMAVEKYGLGIRIKNLEEARPGDFIDFSRTNNTGHTAVFIDWGRENDRIVGIHYWSSQNSTNGIAYNVEYFEILNSAGHPHGNIMLEPIYIARVLPVANYRSFRE